MLACATISLLAYGRAVAQPAPAIALLDAADAPQWQTLVKEMGWHVVSPATAANANIDQRVQALAAAVRAAIQNGDVDRERVYLAGRGDAAAAVFYTISRVPDLWAAAAALGGSPQAAIETGRIFAANFKNAPVLWAGNGAGDQTLAEKLKSAGMNIEWRTAGGLTNSAVFGWLGSHARDPFPAAVDCETNSPAFASCYWIEMTKFDAAERNDVLPSTRLAPTRMAALDLGGFSYKKDDPGPGVLVSALPEKYSGPLKVGDRIVELDGREIGDARRFTEKMGQVTEERAVMAMVERSGRRIRVETRYALPRVDAFATARVQGQYVADERVIQIISRTITQMRVTVPQQWAGGTLNWNGLPLEKIEEPGCILLTVEKELLHAAKCP